MNILPKKRWHVRTKANIERVRRDEENAAIEEKELQRRIKLAEQEARTEHLRQKAKGLTDIYQEDKGSSGSQQTQKKHINFFKEVEEAGRYLGGSNKEYEAEKRSEKEKFESKIGLLTYLGQSSLEASGGTPWYLKEPNNRVHKPLDSEKKEVISSKKCITLPDPLDEIRQYLLQKKKKDKHIKGKKQILEKTEKKHTNERKYREKKSSKKTLEELRAERLKREKEEREKAKQLLARVRGQSVSSQVDVSTDDRLRRYNSQFNPHLSR